MPSSPARSTVDSEKTGQDGKCQWYLPSFGGSRPHFSRHTKESTPSTLYTFNNHSTAFWQDNDPDPYKMLASKFATLSTGVPVAQSTFNNAEKIFLVGSKSQRAIKKEDFVAACPDLVQYVVARTLGSNEFILQKPGLSEKALTAFADSVEKKPQSYIFNEYNDYDKFTAEQLAKIGKTHLALYEASDKPMYPELRSKAYDNFLNVYGEAISKSSIPQELCKLTESAFQDPDTRTKLASKLLDHAKGNIEVVKASALADIFSKHCGRLWTRMVEPRAVANGSNNVATAWQQPMIPVERDVEANTADLEPPQTGHSGENIAKADEVYKQNVQLKTQMEESEFAKDQLRSELQDARKQIEQLKDNGRELIEYKVRVAEVEKIDALSKAENKMLYSEIANVKAEWVETKSKLDSKDKEIQKLLQAAESARLLKLQKADVNDSAHQRKNVLLQKEMVALRTENENIQTNLRVTTRKLEAEQDKLRSAEDQQAKEVKQLDETIFTQGEKITYLEKRVETEQAARKEQSQRAIDLEKKLQANEALLKKQEAARKAAEAAADIAVDHLNDIRRAAEKAMRVVQEQQPQPTSG